MIPIFKNKGSKSDPNSSIGVTLNLCTSKVFSAVLNNRLKNISDEFELITYAQDGFKKGFLPMTIYLFCMHLYLFISILEKNCFVHLLISKVFLTLCGG